MKIRKRGTIYAEGFFPSDGRWLFYRCWYTLPQRGEILAVHGACEHSGRYQDLAQDLVDQGYNFYIFDMSGHGRSEGKRAYIHKFEEYLVDIANFYGFLRTYRNMQIPFLLGHSLGGLITSLFTAWGHCPVKGLVLSGPLFNLKRPLTFFKKTMLQFLSAVYPTFYIENRIDPTLLTHDSEIVEEYLVDPMVQRYITARCCRETLKATRDVMLTARYLQVPCLILHGELDQISDVNASKAFFDKIPGDKDFYLLRGSYHELFNEIGRNQIIAKTVNWLTSKS